MILGKADGAHRDKRQDGQELSEVFHICDCGQLHTGDTTFPYGVLVPTNFVFLKL